MEVTLTIWAFCFVLVGTIVAIEHVLPGKDMVSDLSKEEMIYLRDRINRLLERE